MITSPMKNSLTPLARGPPIPPTHDLISSERYIESLENRLKRVQGRNAREPTAKDMLSALERVKEDQMQQFIDSQQSSSTQTDNFDGAIINKTHSGKQQSTDEIVALVYQDSLTKDRDQCEGNSA